jgi:hypothetical protein
MNYPHRNHAAQEHREVSALIPWYVNDSIGEHERQRVDAHLQTCAQCRTELARDRLIYQGMNAEPAIEYMPALSLKRLQARLDETEAADPKGVDSDARRAGTRGGGSMPWRGLMAASIAVAALALGLIAGDRWLQLRARAAQPNYYTVTAATPRPPDEVIRAVFSPNITLVELQRILDEAGLRIISGPTEAGVYSLAANSSRPVSSSLALLREHSKVRFAESTQANARPQPNARPGDSP